MSAIARVVVAITALASFVGVSTSTAGAVTWHNTGSTAFTATSGPGTLSVGANNLACAGGQASGTASTTTVTGSVYTVNSTGTLSPCNLVGQSTFVQCTVSTLTASTFSAGVSMGSVTVTCFVRLTANPAPSLCVISGSTPGSYTNPTGLTPGRATGFASTSLIVNNGTVACPLGTGNGALTERSGAVTAGTPTSLGPILNRTP